MYYSTSLLFHMQHRMLGGGCPSATVVTKPAPEADVTAPTREPVLTAQGVRIRRATADDLPGVVRVDARVSRVEKSDYWHDVYERYATRRRDERFFLVAVSSGDGAEAVVGFIVGEIRAWEFGSERCGWIFALSVDFPARMVGVGGALMDAMLDHFRAAGVATVRTMVSRENHLIMSFFRSRGMRAGPYIELEMRMDD